MVTTLLLTHALLSFAPEQVPQPGFHRADVEVTPKKELPDRLVPVKDGSFYVLRTAEGSNKWPVVWIDRFDANGNKQWSKLHDIDRNTAGVGFEMFNASATDTDGNLYFSFYSALNTTYHQLAKIRPDGSVAWRVQNDHCGYVRAILPVPGSSDVVVAATTHGDTCVARYSGSDGAERWQRWSGQGDNWYERSLGASIDADGNLVTVSERDKKGGNTSDLKMVKFDLSGNELWTKTRRLSGDYSSGGLPKVVGVFTDKKDRGILAVYKVLHEDVIEVHRYSPDGALQVRKVIETADKLGDSAKVFAKYAHVNGKPSVVVAWDDRKSDTRPATEIGMIPVLFRKVKKPKISTGGKSSGGMAKSAKTSKFKKSKGVTKTAQYTWVWEASNFPEHRITSDDHDFLEGMDLASGGRTYLLTTDIGGRDKVRVTAVPGLPTGSPRSVTHVPSGRQARGVDMFIGANKLVHVLGTSDATAGPANSGDVDVMRLEFWTVAPPKPQKHSSEKRPATKMKKSKKKGMYKKK